MNRLIQKLVILVALLSLLPSCGKNDQAKGPSPAGTLSVNGTSLNGSVETSSVRIYLLAGLSANKQYLVRTTIAPGGTLSAAVYSDFASYKAGAAPIRIADEVTTGFYEVLFTAVSDGDHVVVLSGTPSSAAYNSLYFYGLRLMSANDTVLSAFTTTLVDPTLGAFATGSIAPDSMVVYSAASITPPGTYTVFLTSSTVSLSYPQMFIYDDDSLSLRTLHYSVVSDVTSTFVSSLFTTSTPSTIPASTSTFPQSKITTVSFPTSSGGPFILLKGVSQATYTLQIGGVGPPL